MTPTGFKAWPREDDTWGGEWIGGAANVSLIFFNSEGPGHGPKLHSHPYPETFVIRQGRALFRIGDTEIEAGAGDIVVAPANTPHQFRTLGDGRYESIDIHVNGTFETTWLE